MSDDDREDQIYRRISDLRYEIAELEEELYELEFSKPSTVRATPEDEARLLEGIRRIVAANPEFA